MEESEAASRTKPHKMESGAGKFAVLHDSDPDAQNFLLFSVTSVSLTSGKWLQKP